MNAFGRAMRIIVVAGFTWAPAAAATAQSAQPSEPPDDAAVHAGPLTLSPVLRLTNLGHDSNVFNQDDDANPQGDMTATLSPVVDGWLRSPHLRVNARSQFDFYYYKELTDLRAVDRDHSGRVDVPLNRLTPYVIGSILDTRHRQNLEIDSLARRQIKGATAGVDLRLTPKLTAGVSAHRARLKYEDNSRYLGVDLAHEMNHTSVGEGATVRLALTPYTTFGVSLDRERERFATNPIRDANSESIGPYVEFSPLALVSGRASVAFRRSRFLTGEVPEFRGTVAFADLMYTLRARTRVTVSGRRALEYSYLFGQSQYIESSLTAGVTQRVADAWDVGGSIGRGRLNYRQSGLTGSAGFSDETILSAGADVGYNLRRTRVGFHLDYRTRSSGAKIRGYDRLRIGSTITYTF